MQGGPGAVRFRNRHDAYHVEKTRRPERGTPDVITVQLAEEKESPLARQLPESLESVASPIRVGLLILELSRGGAETALVRLATSLDRRRYLPVVYTMSSRPQDLQNSLAPILANAGIEVVELGVRGAVGIPAALLRLSRRLRRDRIDVLQCFMFHANILGRFAGRLAGVPVVCAGVRVAEREAPKRLRLDCATRALVDAWVCVGESVAEFTRGTGIPSERVVSIPNGVEDFAGEAAPAAGSRALNVRRRAISVGRLTRQKGFDWFLERLAEFRASPSLSNWEFWIVGDGEERESLERLCAEKELTGLVRFTGWRADARELVASSDLFVLPSRWEGMPNALLEASIAGVAALCAGVEGVGEVLGGDEPDGKLQITTPGDGAEWRAKLERLLTDDALRSRLGWRNRVRALERFTVSATTRQYEELWRRLLASKARVVSEPPPET